MNITLEKVAALGCRCYEMINDSGRPADRIPYKYRLNLPVSRFLIYRHVVGNAAILVIKVNGHIRPGRNTDRVFIES